MKTTAEIKDSLQENIAEVYGIITDAIDTDIEKNPKKDITEWQHLLIDLDTISVTIDSFGDEE